MKTNRVNNVLKEMEKQGLKQMIVSSPPAIFYLTGKWFSPGERLVALYLNTNGNHKLIEEFRMEQKIARTKIKRPDLYQKWQEKNNN